MTAGAAARPFAFLQYYNATNQSIGGAAGGTLTIDLVNDASSFPSSFMDKPSASGFRVLRDCTVRVSYGATLDASANNEGTEVHVAINGTTIIQQSRSGDNARTPNAEPTGVSRTFLVDLSANDVLELRLAKLENNTITATTIGTMMLVELVRLR
jgi:hypothetical protein